MEEICSTETTYAATLLLVRDQFLVPFRAEASRGKDGLLSLEDVRIIFSDVEVILNYSQSLLEELKPRVLVWRNDTSTLGDIFLKISHFLKTYQPYVVNYGASMSSLQKCCKDPRFSTLLRQLESDPRCKNGSLQSFLITPIQRIPRYMLLLKELLKCTLPIHPDFEQLTRSLEQIQQIATALNEAERSAESAFKLFTFQMALSGGDGVELLAPHRRYVTEGLIRGNLKSDSPDSEMIDHYLLLCNDCLLVCKAPNKRLSLKAAPRADSASKLASLTETPQSLVWITICAIFFFFPDFEFAEPEAPHEVTQINSRQHTGKHVYPCVRGAESDIRSAKLDRKERVATEVAAVYKRIHPDRDSIGMVG